MKIRIDKKKLSPLEQGKNYFQALSRFIINQQLSTKAADSIYKRFVALFAPKRFPKPEDVIKMSEAKLRKAGLSRGKVVYVKDLARRFLDGTIDPKKIPKMSDQEIIDHLIKVKGVGVWTAHMFLIFTLNRPDILPTGDLVIRKGFQKAFKLSRIPTHDEMVALAKAHEGERTLLSRHLWSIFD